MATQEEKAFLKARAEALKAEAKAARQERKALASAGKREQKELARTERKVIQAQAQALRKGLKLRVKEQRGPAKVAHKQTTAEMSRMAAINKARKVPQRFQGLPFWARLVGMGLAYIWLRGSWQKEHQKQQVREARRFVYELNHRDCDPPPKF